MRFKLVVFGCLLVCVGFASDAKQISPTQLVNDYLSAREATMKSGAKEKDVDKALTYLADDAVYEHPRANARTVGKAAIRAGMIGFLGAAESVRTKTLSRMSNSSAVVVEQQVEMTIKDNGKLTHVGRTQITVYEVKGDKISRIIDYWQPKK